MVETKRRLDSALSLRVRLVLLLVASISLSLVLGELIARVAIDEVYLQRPVRDAGVLIPYEPDSEADLLTDEFRVRYRTNRFGYRDRLDRRAERTPGVARVGLLGDSLAAGWGVEFEETFGARFERATGIEMVNASRNGGCALWFVPQARHLRKRFAPDWLLVQIFDNDPEDNVGARLQLEIADRRAVRGAAELRARLLRPCKIVSSGRSTRWC